MSPATKPTRPRTPSRAELTELARLTRELHRTVDELTRSEVAPRLLAQLARDHERIVQWFELFARDWGGGDGHRPRRALSERERQLQKQRARQRRQEVLGQPGDREERDERDAQAYGLDPSLGLMHTDKRYRGSLAHDLIEPVRPVADGLVIELLGQHELRRGDVYETREGVCRLGPALVRPARGRRAALQRRARPLRS